MKTKQFRLPKKPTQKWLKALRSGKYSQGKHQLYDNNGNYCCLGVICAINGFQNFGESQYIATGTAYYNLKEIPIGVPTELVGTVGNNDLIKELVKLNDDDQKSFLEIADWIKDNVELY